MPTFTATDGTEFTDRGLYRKYEFKTRYTCSKLKGETFVRNPGEIEGQPFVVEDCDDCEIMLLCHSDSLQIDYCKGCRIFIGPCCESVFIRNCDDCVITIACKQLRTRDCHNCEIYEYGSVDPIIELSDGMRFAPFNGAYAGLDKQFEAAGLDPQNNHWMEVFDFNDEAKTGEHWSLIPKEERKPTWEIEVPGGGTPVNPVPEDAVATVWDCDDPRSADYAGNQMATFDIRTTTMEEAQAAIPLTKEEEEERKKMGMSIEEYRAEHPDYNQYQKPTGVSKITQ